MAAKVTAIQDRKRAAVLSAAHTAAAKSAKRAKELREAALDLCTIWERAQAAGGAGDQAALDNACRRFYRAAAESNDAANAYITVFVARGPETMKIRWAKLAHWFRVKVLRQETQ